MNSANISDPAYFGREQTKVKHELLRRYLAPAARIIGDALADCIVYVDCCSGPWKSVAEDLSDTSFSIAVRELLSARDYLAVRNRKVEFRCLFIEEDPEAFERLKQFCDSEKRIELKPLEGDFTQKINSILTFVDERRKSFPFFFIDPTGWSPLVLDRLGPLLQHTPSEVLINFMTSHIKRFLEVENFETRFGPDYMCKVVGSTGQDRDDLAAFSFADEIRKFYRYTCTSVIINPLRDQTHFHMIYGTRHPRGVAKFKEAEKSCFGVMQAVRINAHLRNEEDIRQQKLFDDLAPDTDHYVQQLRIHYLQRAFEEIEQTQVKKSLNAEEAWEIASRYPLVWESDVRNWYKSKTNQTPR